MKRILIVGEAPNYEGAEPFSGPTGRRLDQLIGCRWQDVADGVNLLPPQERDGKGRKFDMAAARASAKKLVAKHSKAGGFAYGAIIFAGLRVADAFGFNDLGMFCIAELPIPPGGQVAVGAIPHPSGVVRLWNDSGVVRRAAEFMATVAAVQPGSHRAASGILRVA